MKQARINNTEHAHTMQGRHIQIHASSFVHLVCTIRTNSMEPRSSLGPPLIKKLTTLYASYHYQVYKTPSPVSILSHMNPVHICTVLILIILHTCFEKKMLQVIHTLHPFMSLYCNNIHRMGTTLNHGLLCTYNATKRIIIAINFLHNFLASMGPDHGFVSSLLSMQIIYMALQYV
jgi:hypothetical protein